MMDGVSPREVILGIHGWDRIYSISLDLMPPVSGRSGIGIEYLRLCFPKVFNDGRFRHTELLG